MKDIFIFLIVMLFGCNTPKFELQTITTVGKTIEPPNGIKISRNLYIDKTEVSNISYFGYLAWLGNEFGVDSKEFIDATPNANVWTNLHPKYTHLNINYMTSEVYHNYPVVGVSYEQALKYSKWRSDRVMEMMLIENKIIPWNPNPPKDSVFTIEKYYEGKYYNIIPDKMILYPYYSFPDSNVFKLAALFADSLNIINYKSCEKNECLDKLLIGCNCLEKINDRSLEKPYGYDPIQRISCGKCSKPIISHLKGNVREMTNIEGQYFGLSFIDSCKTTNYILRTQIPEANCYTGFRNVCEWREWK